MRSSRRIKRMGRNRRKISKMDLTSLMDVFTILVFFLLINSGSIEIGRFVVSHRVAIALLPVGEQVRIETTAPSHSALEKRELQPGEPHRHAVHHQAATCSLTGRGKVSDVVEDVIVLRVAAMPAHRARVERR